MILKYYHNGWNYIDEIEDVKWINIDLVHMFNDCFHAQDTPYQIIDTDPREPQMLRLKHMLFAEMGSVEAFKHAIAPAMGKKFMDKEECGAASNYNLHLVDWDIHCILSLYRNDQVIIDRGNNPEYARVIFYTRNNQRYAEVFIGCGYLLNNHGATIEKIG